jgi:hypothetical protein
MSINKPYETAADLPGVMPVFPLPGVLLLPRGELPLNIFEPRYLAMVDDALKTHRLIAMIQPALKGDGTEAALESIGCAGRITQFAETGDGRYMLALTGIARCRIIGELSVLTPYRQCEVAFGEFGEDFVVTAASEAGVDRASIVEALEKFAKANKLRIDWDEVKQAPLEALVNALSMMCPFGPGEKQALLEAQDLKARADVLIAITEIELARRESPRHLQ